MAVVCYEMLRTVYEKEYSEVMELFYGIYVSEIRSSITQKVHSQKPEMYFIVDVPIPLSSGTVDLYQCFDLFTQDETLEGDNAWYNETTKEKESVHKQLRFWNFPNILVISLKRFSSIGHNKRQDLVTFPLEGLDLSKYVCGYNAKQYVYDLMGICNHMGGVMGGHYTAFVKNSDQVWVHYNDVVCEKVDNLEKLVSPMAYCLFYRKRTVSS
jgi:ubiquitin C-terminal hydrolase